MRRVGSLSPTGLSLTLSSWVLSPDTEPPLSLHFSVPLHHIPLESHLHEHPTPIFTLAIAGESSL